MSSHTLERTGAAGAHATPVPGAVQRHYAIIEAPSILGLRSTGVDRLSERLLENGFADRIQARRAERIEMRSRPGTRDPETKTNNAREIAEWTPRLADAIQRVVDSGDFPLILGGDCSIVLGAMLALRRAAASTASSFTSTRTCSTTASCLRSTTACRTDSAGAS